MTNQTRGSAAVERESHNLNVGGSIPSPATRSSGALRCVESHVTERRTPIGKSGWTRRAGMGPRPMHLQRQRDGARSLPLVFNPKRKHMKSKPGTADGQAIVRRSTIGADVRVGQTPPCLRDSRRDGTQFTRKRVHRWSGSMEAVPTTQTGECLSGKRQIPLRRRVNGRDGSERRVLSFKVHNHDF